MFSDTKFIIGHFRISDEENGQTTSAVLKGKSIAFLTEVIIFQWIKAPCLSANTNGSVSEELDNVKENPKVPEKKCAM